MLDIYFSLKCMVYDRAPYEKAYFLSVLYSNHYNTFREVVDADYITKIPFPWCVTIKYIKFLITIFMSYNK